MRLIEELQETDNNTVSKELVKLFTNSYKTKNIFAESGLLLDSVNIIFL